MLEEEVIIQKSRSVGPSLGTSHPHVVIYIPVQIYDPRRLYALMRQLRNKHFCK